MVTIVSSSIGHGEMEETRPVDGGALLSTAVAAAISAGEMLLLGRQNGSVTIDTKASPDDLVTNLDRACESLIVGLLTRDRPDDGVLGEEGGERPGRSGVRWIVDPLDGTANYVHGHPSFAVSIAAEVDGSTIAGVVHDPSRRETFSALRGAGAWCDGERLLITGQGDLQTALLGTGFSHDRTVRTRQSRLLARLTGRVLDVRASGSAALDLCWVAAGRLGVYYESDTRHWDRAAGVLVALEAGAWVGDLDCGPPSDRMVIAGAPKPAQELRKLLKAYESAISRR
jgi:myo-inositol-1(or 4)-monophosphatase